MSVDPVEIRQYVEGLLKELAGDWDFAGDITGETCLFADLGYESLDVVILGTSIQEHYGRPMPFAELLAEVGQRDFRDLTVGELVAFVDRHLRMEASEGA